MSSQPDSPDFRFDHAVIVVPRLKRAIELYRQAGFSVAPGGSHEGSPTHNALIPLQDGSYLELLATRQPLLPHLLHIARHTPLWRRLLASRSPIQQRFLGHFSGSWGVQDFALWTSRIEDTVARCTELGVPYQGPHSMGRMRPDGQRLEWRIAAPAGPCLPFLIEDITPRELRVPSGEGTSHRIGVTGTAEVQVYTQDRATAVDQYRALLGQEPSFNWGGSAAFVLGNTTIRIVSAPPEAHSPLSLVLAAPAGATLPPAVRAAGITTRSAAVVD